jgi:hypothetical protein
MDQHESSLESILHDGQHDCETEPRFPEKLHDILGNAKERGYDHVMSWLDGGTSFKIHNKKAIEQVVIPIHFPGMTCGLSGASSTCTASTKMEVWNSNARCLKRRKSRPGHFYPLASFPAILTNQLCFFFIITTLQVMPTLIRF